MLGSVETLQRVRTPADIVGSLPSGSYGDFYQPQYPDAVELEAHIDVMQGIEHATEPEHVVSLRQRLAEIAHGEETPIIMDGRCSEPLRLGAVAELAREAVVSEQIIAAAGISRAVRIKRACGQLFKPRSEEFETLADGTKVASFMGEGINDLDPHDRTPDPERLVRGMEQSRDLQRAMTELTGHHVMVGHEALSLAYEGAQMYVDPNTGKKVILSGDLLWIGERTNRTDTDNNPHIDLLAEVENPIGVKIGPKSSAEHIASLAERLNPDNEAGKLIFMIRAGDKMDAIKSVLTGIKEKASNAIIMFDIHGSTDKTAEGLKRRSVEATVEHIRLLAEACAEQGLRLHGIHVETTGDTARQECVAGANDSPNPDMKPDVDPLFNPEQFQAILEQAKRYLPGGATDVN